jgi:hypothetical protein
VKALLVACTDSGGASHDAAFNHWYSNTHVAEVLTVPGFVRAARFKAFSDDDEITQSYLCLYELDVADVVALAASRDELKRRSAAGELTAPPEAATNRAASRARYFAEVGPRVGTGEWPPKGVFMVFTNPASEADDAAFNRWYQDIHLPEVTAVPGFTAATRYVGADVNAPNDPWVVEQRYLAVYELATSDAAEFGDTMTELSRRVREGDRMQMTTALGRPAVTKAYGLIT